MDETSNPNLAIPETSDHNVTVSELSDPNATSSETSDQNVIVSELPDHKLPISETSDQNVTVSKPSVRNPSIPDTSPSRKTQPPSSDDAETSKRAKTGTDDSEFSEKRKSYDFAFILRPAKILNIAIEAFSDPNLNPAKEVLIKVSPNGCEISLWHVDKTGNEVFGMLQLKRAGLEGFQCTKPMRKMLPLTALPRVLRAADVFNPESVAIFVEESSNRISFQWGTSALDFALGRPINIDLEHAEMTYEEFPPILYMHETVVPSKDFITMISMPSRDIGNGAYIVELNIRPETAGDEVMSSEELYQVRMELSFRESLERASNLAENCSVYLIRDPQALIMLSFKLGEVGEMVYLNETEFISFPFLPIKGPFGSII